MTGMKIKTLFFDEPGVLNAVDKATRRVFTRFGAYVRRSAKSSIRKRKRVSAPGEPPSSHTGLLKKFIFFSYEPYARTVVIGPMALNSKTGTAPAALEYGGTSSIFTGSKNRRTKKRVNITARPFMGPAYEQEEPKLPDMWANSIR